MSKRSGRRGYIRLPRAGLNASSFHLQVASSSSSEKSKEKLDVLSVSFFPKHAIRSSMFFSRAPPCRNISMGSSASSLYLQHSSFCFEMDSAYAHVRCASFSPLKKAVVLRHGFSRALLCRNISVAITWPMDSETSELKIYGLLLPLFFQNCRTR
jgi:hypothetical protein